MQLEAPAWLHMAWDWNVMGELLLLHVVGCDLIRVHVPLCSVGVAFCQGGDTVILFLAG